MYFDLLEVRRMYGIVYIIVYYKDILNIGEYYAKIYKHILIHNTHFTDLCACITIEINGFSE